VGGIVFGDREGDTPDVIGAEVAQLLEGAE
jgi:hypothetical protein